MKVSMAMTLAFVFGAAAGCAHSAGSAQSPSRADEASAEPDDDGDKGPVRACAANTTELAPPDGKITPSQGKIATYPLSGSAAPTVTTTNGTLHVSAKVPVKAEAQYAGVVLAFPKCTDASAFAGVRFKIRGSYSGCSMEYATTDEQHEDRKGGSAFATGGRGAYPPQTRLDQSQVTQVAQTVTIPFNGHTIRGNPARPLDKAKLTGVLWQFTVGMASNTVDSAAPCVADLDIDDVLFYR